MLCYFKSISDKRFLIAMRTELFLAGRYLRPRRNMVSLITFSSILGVTLGVAVLLVVLAVMTGFTDLMKEKLIETQSHFQIRARGNYAIGNAAPILLAVKECGAEAAPVVRNPVLVQYNRSSLDVRSLVMGVRESDLTKYLKLDQALTAGAINLDKRGAVIGEPMARRMRLKVGDRIILHSANRLSEMVRFSSDGKLELNREGKAFLPLEVTVRGIYSLGKYDFDSAVLFIDIDEAAELFGLPWGSATTVFGWGKDAFDQKILIGKLRARLPFYNVSTWEDDNRQLLGVLNVEKRMMFFLLIFIVLVAAFSIANTLITSVYQKTREIGLLKALGATDGAITGIFLLQGTLIGVIGSVAGVVLGTLVITFRNDILHLVSRWTGAELFPKEFYYFNELPAHIVPQDVAFIVVSSIVLCTLGALLPAWRAARLDPARALRYE